MAEGQAGFIKLAESLDDGSIVSVESFPTYHFSEKKAWSPSQTSRNLEQVLLHLGGDNTVWPRTNSLISLFKLFLYVHCGFVHARRFACGVLGSPQTILRDCWCFSESEAAEREDSANRALSHAALLGPKALTSVLQNTLLENAG